VKEELGKLHKENGFDLLLDTLPVFDREDEESHDLQPLYYPCTSRIQVRSVTFRVRIVEIAVQRSDESWPSLNIIQF
jgi:hypothetical protein